MKFGGIDINTLSKGFSKDYQSNFDSRLMNEFATAAYRVGHTLIPGLINMYSTVKNRLQVSLEYQVYRGRQRNTSEEREGN